MSESKYIGRGEFLVRRILYKLVDCKRIEAQVNIRMVIGEMQYEMLDTEIQKHNFDFVIRKALVGERDIVVEVNYKHKEKAAKKWRQIFIPLIKKAGYDYLTINDWDCRERGLFWLNTKKEHPGSWNDCRDVIDALQTAGIKPNLFIE